MGPSVIVGRQGTPYKEISCACSPVKGATMHVAPGCPGPTPVQAQSPSVATTSLPANSSLPCRVGRVKGRGREGRGQSPGGAAPAPFHGCMAPRSGRVTPVQTTQIAPTILSVLGLDPQALQAVQMEKTQVLPGLVVDR